MRKNKALIRITALIIILLVLSLTAYALNVSEKGGMPPFEVVTDRSDVCRVGSDISIYKSSSKYYLFLPASVDLDNVKVRYTGDLQFYNDETGELYGKDSVVSMSLQTGTVAFFEYDKGEDTYYMYSVNVMKAESCATIYMKLDGGDRALKTINSSHSATAEGTVTITDNDGSVIFDGALTKLKGHGLTSYEGSGQLNTKNSYNINIGEKCELIPGAGKSKKWTMLRIRTSGNYDATGMSYITAFYTYNALVRGSYFNICARFVDVYINGEYRGVYILTERMDNSGSMKVTDLESLTEYKNVSIKSVNKKTDPAIAAGIKSYSYNSSSNTADDVDITGGYVLEVMCGHYGECGFQTKHGMYLNIKNPAYPSQEQVQYIAKYVQDFENALFSATGYNSDGHHYTEYIDETSWAAQTLVYAYYLNWEIYRTSTYIHKDVDGSEHGVLTFGPVWDFESGPGVLGDTTLFGTTFAYDVEQQYTWFQQAWKKGDYVHLVWQMNERMKGIINVLLGKSTGNEIFTFDDMSEFIRTSQEMNWVRWKQPDTYAKRLKSMKSSLDTRYTNWFGNIWNDSKYLMGITADSVKNDDGTVTLTATVYGKSSGDVTWYTINPGYETGTEVAAGTTVTVEGGYRYYAEVSGPNNAYSSNATGKVFKNKTIKMISNIIGGGIEGFSAETAGIGAWDIQNTEKQTVYVADKNNVSESADEIPAAEAGIQSEKDKGKADKAEKAEKTEKTEKAEQKSISDADWIIMAAGIVVIAVIVSVISLKDGKSRKEKGNA